MAKKCEHEKEGEDCLICQLEDDNKQLEKVSLTMNAITIKQRNEIEDQKKEIENSKERLIFLDSKIEILVEEITKERNQSNVKIKHNYEKPCTKKDIYCEFGIEFEDKK